MRAGAAFRSYGRAGTRRRAACGAGSAQRKPPDDRLCRNAVSITRSERKRLCADGLRPSFADGSAIVAVLGQNGRNDRLGALGQPKGGRLVLERGYELVQSPCLRRGRRLAVRRGRRHPAGEAGLCSRALCACSGPAAAIVRGGAAYPARHLQICLDMAGRHSLFRVFNAGGRRDPAPRDQPPRCTGDVSIFG